MKDNTQFLRKPNLFENYNSLERADKRIEYAEELSDSFGTNEKRIQSCGQPLSVLSKKVEVVKQ